MREQGARTTGELRDLTVVGEYQATLARLEECERRLAAMSFYTSPLLPPAPDQEP